MLLLAAALLPALLPRNAAAHAILLDSHPAAGGAVPAGAIAIHLRYNSRIDQVRSRLLLIRPDHNQAALTIAPDAAPDVLSAEADLPPGRYVLRWQVLAIDGHITRGEVPFTVNGR